MLWRIFTVPEDLTVMSALLFCFQEQYDFCHQMVLAYLDEYETYANFR